MDEEQQEAKDAADAEEGRRQQDVDEAEVDIRPTGPEKEEEEVLRFFDFDPREHSDNESREHESLGRC